MRMHENHDFFLRRKDFRRENYQRYINKNAHDLFDGQKVAINTTGRIELSENELKAIAELRKIVASMQEKPSLIPDGLESMADLVQVPRHDDKHNPEALVVVGILGSSIAEIAGTTFQVEKFKKLSLVVKRTLRAVESSDRERIMQGVIAVSREVDEAEKYRNRVGSHEIADKKGVSFLNKMLSFGRGAVL